MIHVCFALHDKYKTYSKYLGVAVCSLFVNVGQESVTVHILHDDTLSEDNKEKFIHLAAKYNQNIVFHYIDTGIFQTVKHMTGNYTVGTLFRLKVPEIIPDSIDKIIFLDSDLIIHVNIAELWKVDLSNHYLAACVDQDESILNNQWLYSKGKAQDDHYFNAGVLVMNLKLIRNLGNLFQISMKFLMDHPECKFADQDAFNYIFYDKVIFLDPHYNLFSRRLSNTCDDLLPGIYHFAGDAVNLESYRNVDRLFISYLMRTEWGNSTDTFQYLQSWVAFEKKKFFYLQKLNKRLNHNNTLKIILFGANSVLLPHIGKLVPENRIAYFVDNNKNMHNTKVNDLYVNAPEILSSEKKGTFVVIVMSKKYYDSISIQLSNMGLVEDEDFYDARLLLRETEANYYNENKIRGFFDELPDIRQKCDKTDILKNA